MTWTAYHSRGELLRTVVATADERRDGRLPMDLDGVAETFDELDLLGALLLRWHTRLSGTIEREQADQPFDLEASVVRAWRATADEMPGVVAIIDHYRSEPTSPEMAQAIAVATAKQRTLLAVMAGRAGQGDGGAPGVGQRIEERARSGWTPQPRRAEDRTGQHRADRPAPRLIHRLKAAFAA